MPHSLTSAPVRGALQVEAIEPISTQIFRLARSIHFQSGTCAGQLSIVERVVIFSCNRRTICYGAFRRFHSTQTSAR